MSQNLLRHIYRVPREKICYISWTVDAWDGMGFLVTDDGRDGVVSIYCSESYRDDLSALMDAFRAEGMDIETIEPRLEEPVREDIKI